MCRHQRSHDMENDHCFYCFWSRYVLLNGPKLHNTNCTEMFSQAAIMRHYHQTSGCFQANNNNSERFFKLIPLGGKCFISSILSRSWWYAFHQQCEPPSSLMNEEYWTIIIGRPLHWHNFCKCKICIYKCDDLPSYNLSSDLHLNHLPNLLSVTTSANAYLMSNRSFVSTIWTCFYITAT